MARMPSPLSPLGPLEAPPPAPPRTPVAPPPRRRNPPAPESSVGALWVAGLGAFLVIVGAATFVAVRWDEIPAVTKLGALVAVTIGCLAAHRLLREPLPVTSVVLLHLGVLLTPIDVAAVGTGLHWDWPRMLLAVGAATAVVPNVARRADRSLVLRLAGGGGVVLVAGGLGAVAGVPSGLLLAVAALVAALVTRLDRQPEAVVWAVVAGLALPLAAPHDAVYPAAEVLEDLGLTGAVPPLAAALTGLLAGVTLGVVGRRREDVVLALVGVASVATGAVTAWMRMAPGPGGPSDVELSFAAVASLTLLAEVAAWVWRDDAFWRQVTGAIAVVGEVAAAAVTFHLLEAIVEVPDATDPSPAGALAALLTALTWLTAVTRRPLDRTPAPTPPPPAPAPPPWGSGPAMAPRPPTPGDAGAAADRWPAGWAGRAPATGSPAAAAPWRPAPGFGAGSAPRLPTPPVDALAPAAAGLAAAAGVALATASAALTGVALAVAGLALLAADPARLLGRTGTRTSGVVATLFLLAAPLLVTDGGLGPHDPAGAAWAAGALGLAGALGTAIATVRMSRAPGVRAAEAAAAEAFFTLLALGPLATGTVVLGDGATVEAGVVAAVAGLWAVAGVLDQVGSRPGRLPVAMVPRLALAAPLAVALALGAGTGAALAGLMAALVLLDAVRLDEPNMLAGTGVASLVVAGSLTTGAGWSVPAAGLALSLTGCGWLLVGRSLPRRWAAAALANAVVAAGVGLVASLEDDRLLAVNLLLVGAVTAVAGALVARRDVVVAGATLATGGLWIHLSVAGVTAAEPYVLPVAAATLVAGLLARRDGPVSSWVAYTPAVALLGGAALGERLGGGPAWHGLVAGGVGAVAVVVGGTYRLVGPLLTGTALVLAVSVHETLGVTAQVPTWLWLCTGGAALLGAGVGMERRGLGPVDAGRRVVDVIRAQYS
jgi:hypothetical protein